MLIDKLYFTSSLIFLYFVAWIHDVHISNLNINPGILFVGWGVIFGILWCPLGLIHTSEKFLRWVQVPSEVSYIKECTIYKMWCWWWHSRHNLQLLNYTTHNSVQHMMVIPSVQTNNFHHFQNNSLHNKSNSLEVLFFSLTDIKMCLLNIIE